MDVAIIMYMLIYIVHDWRIRIQLDASTEKNEIEEHHSVS